MSIDVTGERIAIRSYVYPDVMVNSCEPVIDLVRQLLAEIESAPGLVEDETISTTWTTQVATVIYGQSQMSDLCWRLVGPLVEL
jgi:hypothetical protein